MLDLDSQFEYWNTAGAQKSFAHPLNLQRLSQWLSPATPNAFCIGVRRCTKSPNPTDEVGGLFRLNLQIRQPTIFAPANEP